MAQHRFDCHPKTFMLPSRMSAIGFSPGIANEWTNCANPIRSLNDIKRNLASARKCLQKEDLRMAEHHLRAAECARASEAEDRSSGSVNR